MTKRIIVTATLFIAILLITAQGSYNNLYAQGNPQQKTDNVLRGRDFVRLGEKGIRTGTLKFDEGEWYLVVNKVTYELHLGDHNHRAKTGIELEEGKAAAVEGFIYAQKGLEIIDIAVCTIELDGKEYHLRESDGTPLWRGSGRKKAHNK